MVKRKLQIFLLERKGHDRLNVMEKHVIISFLTTFPPMILKHHALIMRNFLTVHKIVFENFRFVMLSEDAKIKDPEILGQIYKHYSKDDKII